MTGGFVSTRIGFGRTIVRCDVSSLTTGRYTPSGSRTPFWPKPSQDNVMCAPRGSVRDGSSVRTFVPCASSTQTVTRSRVRNRNSTSARRKAGERACGEKIFVTRVPPIGDRVSLARSVIAKATALAASNPRTVAVDRTRANARPILRGLLGEYSALPVLAQRVGEERDHADPGPHLDDRGRGRQLHELDPGQHEHEGERDPKRPLRDADREVRAEEDPRDRADQEPADRVEIDVAVKQVTRPRHPEQRRSVQHVGADDP